MSALSGYWNRNTIGQVVLFLHFVFQLKDDCFTEFCGFLSYINKNHPWVYPCPLPPETSSHFLPHPTLLAGLRAPVWVSWVTQQIPAGYLFYMWYCNRWLTNNRTLLLLLLSRFSRVRLCATQRQQPTRLPRPWDSPGKNPGMGCHFLLQVSNSR